MQYYMTINELSERIKTLLSFNSNKSSPFVNSQLISHLQSMNDPNLLNNDKVADEILTIFLNSLVLAGQLGIPLEQKINEYLIQLEREAMWAC